MTFELSVPANPQTTDLLQIYRQLDKNGQFLTLLVFQLENPLVENKIYNANTVWPFHFPKIKSAFWRQAAEEKWRRNINFASRLFSFRFY